MVGVGSGPGTPGGTPGPRFRASYGWFSAELDAVLSQHRCDHRPVDRFAALGGDVAPVGGAGPRASSSRMASRAAGALPASSAPESALAAPQPLTAPDVTLLITMRRKNRKSTISGMVASSVAVMTTG